MAAVGTPVTQGVANTIDAANEWIEIGCGITANLLTILLEFDGSWNGTVTFEGAMRQTAADGTVSLVWDPVTATNLNGGTEATTSTGGASADEFWRVDASGLDAFRVFGTTVTAGTVNVTFRLVMG